MDGVSSASDPGPPAKPPRSALRVRDLLGAVGLLLAIVFVVGGLTRGCSFAPTGPTVDSDAAPQVDAPVQLRALAGSTPFPVRVPAVPADWRANSVDAVRVGSTGDRAVRTGYLTPDGRYVRVVQSDTDEASLLAVEAEGRPVAEGLVEVAGTRWVIYADDATELIRIADLGDVRLLITGSGSDAEFGTLAAAVVRGEVLP
jgi:hypothetical protein